MTNEAMVSIEMLIEESKKIRDRIIEHIHKHGLDVNNGAFEAQECMGNMEKTLKLALKDNERLQAENEGHKKVEETLRELYQGEVGARMTEEVAKKQPVVELSSPNSNGVRYMIYGNSGGIGEVIAELKHPEKTYGSIKEVFDEVVKIFEEWVDHKDLALMYYGYDDRIRRHVFTVLTKRFGDEDYIKIYGCPQHLKYVVSV